MFFKLFFRDAWTELGYMPKEEAMVKYVEELKKVNVHFFQKHLHVFASVDQFIHKYDERYLKDI